MYKPWQWYFISRHKNNDQHGRGNNWCTEVTRIIFIFHVRGMWAWRYRQYLHFNTKQMRIPRTRRLGYNSGMAVNCFWKPEPGSLYQFWMNPLQVQAQVMIVHLSINKTVTFNYLNEQALSMSRGHTWGREREEMLRLEQEPRGRGGQRHTITGTQAGIIASRQ